jgi:hypothetical protein
LASARLIGKAVKTGVKEIGGHFVTLKANLSKSGAMTKVSGFAAKLMGKGASSTSSTVKMTGAEKAKMLMAAKKEQAIIQISSKSAEDKANLSKDFATVGINKSPEDIRKMGAGDTIAEVRTETAGRSTFERAFVKSDPKSVLAFDLAEKPTEAIEVPGYGKISLQMHKDINQRPPIFEGINLQAPGIKEEDRAKLLMDDMFDKAKASLNGAQGGPSDTEIRHAALLALNGTTQAFEAPGQSRVLNNAKEILAEQKLIGPDTQVLPGQVQKKREFKVWVQDGAIHVKGKNWVGVDVMSDGPDGIPQKSSMGFVLVERHFSIPLNGGDAQRFPDTYAFQAKVPTDEPKWVSGRV